MRYLCMNLYTCIISKMLHYDDVIMSAIASQITSLAVVYSTVYSDADQRKHQSFASLAFVWGIHRNRWIPRTKGQLRGKCFHLMTSPWTRNVSFPVSKIIPHLRLLCCYYPYGGAPSISPREITRECAYSISQEICTRFCCALLCCGYAIVHNEFTWSIYPYSSGLLCWHWSNR